MLFRLMPFIQGSITNIGTHWHGLNRNRWHNNSDFTGTIQTEIARGDDLSNLQPLQWENNRYKGDDFPHWYCKIRA